MNTVTVIDSFGDYLYRVMASMSPAAVHFVVQMAVLVILPTILCGIMYLLSVKAAKATQSTPTLNSGVQYSMLVIGLLAGIKLPVNQWDIYDPTERLWVVSLSTLLAGFLPFLLGFLLVNEDRAQKVTIKLIYLVMIGLSAWQFIRSSSL